MVAFGLWSKLLCLNIEWVTFILQALVKYVIILLVCFCVYRMSLTLTGAKYQQAKFPKWNADKTFLYLLDVLARIAWMEPPHFPTDNIGLQESSKVHRSSKKLVGSARPVGCDWINFPPTPWLPHLSWLYGPHRMERIVAVKWILSETQTGLRR